MPNCCKCCPPEKKCVCKKVDCLVVEDKLVSRGTTKLDNTTQADKLCFRDNGKDNKRWCVQEGDDNNLNITYENTSTKITLYPDGTIETNADVIVNGSVKPFRYIRVGRTTDFNIPAPGSVTLTWESVVENNELTTSDFNLATGLFTAPASGIYSFSLSVNWNHVENSDNRGVGILVSPSSFNPMTFTSAASYLLNQSCQSYSGTFFINEGDQVVASISTGIATTVLVPFTSFEITQLR